MAEEVTIVSVVRNTSMYEACLKGNENTNACELVCMENISENKAVSSHYNAFIETLSKSDDKWIIFCHEDWQPLENIKNLVGRLNRKLIYGPIGAYVSSLFKGDYIIEKGSILECEKDGSGDRQIRFHIHEGLVDTVDCQCVIVHSTTILEYGLRFDPQLPFDMYVEDFCANAYFSHKILTKVIPIRCRHWSRGVISTSFKSALEYVQRKYEGSSKRMASIVGYKSVFGGHNSNSVHKSRLPFILDLLH